MEMKGTLTRQEAAEFLNLSLPVLDGMLKRIENPVPSIRIGRKVIIPVNALQNWLLAESERQHGTAV